MAKIKTKTKATFTVWRIAGLVIILFFILFLTFGRELQNGSFKIQSMNKNISIFLTKPFDMLHHFTSRYFTFSPPPSEELRTAYIQLRSEYTALKEEHRNLSNLLQYTPDGVVNVSVGKVISSPNGLFSKTVLVNVGTEDGVQKDDIAITREGLVGRIIHTEKHHSEILPINHPSSKIVGVEAATGVKLLIAGRYQMYVISEYVTDPLLLKNDMIIRTVSDGQTIPNNIPIGKIIDPYAKPIRIKLALNFKNLQYVRIVRYSQQAEEEIAIDDRDPDEEQGE